MSTIQLQPNNPVTVSLPDGGYVKLFVTNSDGLALKKDNGDVILIGGGGGVITAEHIDGITIPQQAIAGIIVGSGADASIVDVTGNKYLKLHDPYLSPLFITFIINGQVTSLEAGDTIAGGIRTFDWSISNVINLQPNTINISDVTNPTSLATGLGHDGTEDLNIGAPIVLLAGQSQVWKIDAVDTLLNPFQRLFTVNAYWREYYGTSPLATFTEADVEALVNNPLASAFAGVKALAAGGYKWICYPTTFGEATTFTDTGTGFPVPMFDFGTPSTPYELISVTNVHGQTVDYKCHRTLNVLGGSININIS